MFELSLHHRLVRMYLRAFGDTKTRIQYDVYDRPHFAFCLDRACDQSSRLGIKTIAAIEFGVAGGNGLVALEQIAEDVGRLYDVDVQVFGFDAGAGMPAALDYRDTPYIWQPGHFKLDEAKLKSRLRAAKLFIGDVADTLPVFAKSNPPAIGFVSVDTDYYSSAIKVLKLFDLPESAFLPRTFCYLDDIIGYENEYHSEFTGELLAIDEFNASHSDRKIAAINGLRYKRKFPAHWNEMIRILHLFGHENYNTFLNPTTDMQNPLKS